MKILVVPDSFKGSMTSRRICEVAKKAILDLNKENIVRSIPMADGGEGTVEALVYNTGGEIITCSVKNPIGKPIRAEYGILGDGKTAIIEMASASGITLLTEEERNPLITSTYGTGELMLDALDKGCTHFIMGIGGSATNDGGTGMLKALGVKFLDRDEKDIDDGGQGLRQIHRIDLSELDPRLEQVNIRVACDVDNPLYGKKGATYVYGPQKGATDGMLGIIEEGMMHYSEMIKKYLNKDIADIKGAGAAGGLGGGLLAFLNTKLESGFEMISEVIGLEKIISEGNYDLILTGEGQMNHQTLQGKLPYGVGQLAKKYSVPCVAIVGSVEEGYEDILNEGITSVFSIVNKPMSLSEAMEQAENLFYKATKNVIALIK